MSNTCSPLTGALVHDRVVLPVGWMDGHICLSVCMFVLLPSTPSPSFFPPSQPPSHPNPPYFLFWDGEWMDQGVGGTSTRSEERAWACVYLCVCACGSVLFSFSFQCGQQTLLEVRCRQQAHHDCNFLWIPVKTQNIRLQRLTIEQTP